MCVLSWHQRSSGVRIRIPHFDGKNPPLKDFLQDVSNGAVFVTDATEPGFIKAALAKLRGVASESVRGKQFSKVKDLIAHLKKRFARKKIPMVFWVNCQPPNEKIEKQPRGDISDRPRSPSPYSKQIGSLEKRIQPEKTRSRRDSTTSATAVPAHEVRGAAYVPPAYNQYPPIYPPFPQNYSTQYQYPFPAYPPNYPYPPHYPYPLHPSMIQYPTNDKSQKPTSYQSWAGHCKTTGSATPSRSTSPSPSGNLNSQSTRRTDAATSQASPRERPKFVHFRENSAGSYQ